LYNVFHKRATYTSERRTPPKNTTRQLLTTMQQQHNTQSIYREGRIALAISALKQKQFQSVQHAVATYDVPKPTLRRQRAGINSRRDYKANSKKLTKLEKSAIVQHILNLDSQGFAPKLIYIRDMAN